MWQPPLQVCETSGPACQCAACKNLQAQRLISPEEIPGSLVDTIEVDELEVEHDTNTVEDSDDEEYNNQPHWQQNDIDDIMDMVFGYESGSEEDTMMDIP